MSNIQLSSTIFKNSPLCHIFVQRASTLWQLRMFTPYISFSQAVSLIFSSFFAFLSLLKLQGIDSFSFSQHSVYYFDSRLLSLCFRLDTFVLLAGLLLSSALPLPLLQPFFAFDQNSIVFPFAIYEKRKKKRKKERKKERK